MFRQFGRSTIIVTATTAAVLLAGGAGAFALHDANTIHGCYDTKVGALRVTDTCRPNEAAIEWNKEGPQGPPGPLTTKTFQSVLDSADGDQFSELRVAGVLYANYCRKDAPDYLMADSQPAPFIVVSEPFDFNPQPKYSGPIHIYVEGIDTHVIQLMAQDGSYSQTVTTSRLRQGTVCRFVTTVSTSTA